MLAATAVENWYATGARAGSGGGSVATSAAGEIIQGALSVPPVAFGVGVQIGQSVLDGVLSTFGESGAAISRFSHSLVEGVSNIFQQGATGIGSILKGIFGVAGAGLGVAGAVAGGVIGGGIGLAATGGLGAAAIAAPGVGMGAAPAIAALGPQAVIIGAVIGAGLVAGVLSATKHLADAVSGAMGAVVSIFGEIGKVGTQAVQSILDVLKDVMNTALSQSKSIMGLAQQSGLSMADASRAFTTARAFGIDPSQIPNQNTFMQSIMNRISGITGAQGTPENVASFRERYRALAGIGENGQPSSPWALMMAQNMAEQNNMTGYIPAAMQPDRQFNRQLEAVRGLEMPASVVTKFQDDFAGLLNIVTVFSDNVKTTLGTALLPAATAGLEAVIGYWQQNQQVIVDSLFAIGRFVYAELPGMVLGGLQGMVEGAVGFAKGIGGVIESVGGFAHSIADFIRAFQAGDTALGDTIEGILGGIDSLINSFNEMRGVFAGLSAILHNAVTGWVDIFAIFFNQTIGTVTGALGGFLRLMGHGDWADSVSKIRMPTSADLGMTWQDPLDAYEKYAKDDSNLKGQFENLRTSRTLSDAADWLDKAGDRAESAGRGMGKQAEDVAAPILNWLSGAQKSIGSAAERGKDYDVLTRLDRIAANTGATVHNTAETVKAMGCMESRIMEEAATNAAAEAVQGITGISGYSPGGI